ncbi:hypothetical protein [Priestia megaterium]|uniref:Uncharacterized protein n=1 Tax=Priestia megaterium TaxID=1404 RepID=A0A6M6E460_PRIMG|nr:hypothetical protein [Priestia megaterium]QJX80456.1 hypothetical protein FDZ14_30680 [Priestia megaterium]
MLDVTQVQEMIVKEKISVISGSTIEKFGCSKIHITEEAIKNTGLRAIVIDCDFFNSGHSIVKSIIETQERDTLIFSNLFQLNTKKAVETFISFIEKCKFKIIFLNHKERSIHTTIQEYLNKFPSTDFSLTH